MIKAWALVGFDGCVIGMPFATQEVAQESKDGMSYFGEMVDIQEIDYNDEPLSDEGRARAAVLQDLLVEKRITKLHMSKLPGFYKMSADERVEFMINMINIDKSEAKVYGAPKSDVVPQSVKDFVDKLPPSGTA